MCSPELLYNSHKVEQIYSRGKIPFNLLLVLPEDLSNHPPAQNGLMVFNRR